MRTHGADPQLPAVAQTPDARDEAATTAGVGSAPRAAPGSATPAAPSSDLPHATAGAATSAAPPAVSPPSDTLESVGEVEALKRIFPRLPAATSALLGPGDDAAVISAPDARFVVTTDMMIHGPDFRLAWSTPHDLGWKAAVTNLADVAAMGATSSALVVAIAAPLDTPVATLEGIADGLRDACAALAPTAGVVGGDLSVSKTLTLAVTAFGDLDGRAPVVRSGARPGDVVAVAGDLGRAGAGIWLLFDRAMSSADASLQYAAEPRAADASHPPSAASSADASLQYAAEPRAADASHPPAVAAPADPPRSPAPAAATADAPPSPAPAPATEPASPITTSTSPTPRHPDAALGRAVRHRHPALVEAQLAPTSPLDAGVAAAQGGATAMLDVSDGLVLDAGRIASASGCSIDFSHTAIEAEVAALRALDDVIGAQARDFVLCGGEDHALLATFPHDVPLPAGFRQIGVVVESPAGHPLVTVGGEAYVKPGGWDPFSDWNGAEG
ncbi:MAG: thiamine-phosphate kinase [Subtercola sp.]|nr:thiamine-phosphate kinase [Subtercola sp.]